MKNPPLPITICLAILAGCAKPPGSVKPISTPACVYAHKTCSKLAGELGEETIRLKEQEKKQSQAAVADAVTVFLILVPVASLAGGDKNAELAVAKGRVLAIEQQMTAKDCDR